MAPDDHTDYFWSATDVEYRQFFLTMLDYYINQADATANEPTEHQSRFSTDGSLWLWEYEKNKTPGEFQRLVDKLKSGHISAPKNPLVITYGGVPAEAVIRSMYYSGQLERRYGLDFPLAIAMENAGMSFGLGSVWAGAGVQYSWKGVCNCPSLVPNLDNRDHEIYNWVGPDGSSILMKWNSLHRADNNQSIGGYAEARAPAAALDLVTTFAGANGFAARYPYNTIGVFGQGWDDLLTTNLDIQQTCKADSDPGRTCIVSNTTDFFQEFDAQYGAVIPTVSAGFGNEWDLAPASLAEVSARVKRSLERLRSAEALATLVSLADPSFLGGREADRDRAFLNMGLYFEHDFENGGPRVAGSVRIAWQRQVATQIETYVDRLMADATSALGAMIQKTGSTARFFVFNPLSWARTDTADIRYSGALPAHVIDLTSGAEVPSQVVATSGAQYIRIEAPNVPSVGYKVFEVRPGAGQVFANAPTANSSTGVMENEFYRITVSPRGAITSFVDKRLGNREFAGATGGFGLNDLGPGSGSRQVENAGPVSVTLVATGPAPLSHVTRVTLTRGSDRVEIRNEVTQNYGGTQRWRFSFNLTSPDVRHEEVGAIARARLTTAGGSYSPRNARYDYLTLNHFADMSGAGSVGVTLSNADAYFMQVGASSVTTLDTATPQLSVVLGGSLRPYNPILNQAGDSYFLQRFALQSHGAYDQAAAMRFALAHQNPLTVGAVSGGSVYPGSSHSLVSISNPNVLLWSLKPAEEGIGDGVIARVWNLTAGATNFTLGLDEPIASARYVWHTETDRQAATVSAGALTSTIAQNQLLSFRLFPASLPAGTAPSVTTHPASQTIAAGNPATFTVAAAGTAPLAYQWQRNGANIVGATSTSYTIASVTTADNGAVFRAVVSNSSGTATSNAATLTVTSPTGNLVAAYSFNEGANTTVADASGRGHTGTISGATWTTGRSGAGSALSFDGVNDWVTVNDSAALDLTTAMTLEAWVFPTRAGSWQTIVVKERAGNPSVYALMGSTGSTPAPSGKVYLSSGANERIIAPSALPLNTWTHVATTYDGSTLRFYVNGAQVASRALSGAILTSTGPLRIGGNGVAGEFFQGRIDDVRIYSRALTQAEVQGDMNSPVGGGGAGGPSPPAITTHPASQTVTAGNPVTFTVAASGTAPLAYQWQRNGANIAGATSSSYTIASAGAGDNGATFRAVVSNSAGTATSNAATLTVTSSGTAPSVTTHPASQTVTAGNPVTFTVAASGTAPLAYQWQRNGANIAGATSSSYTIASAGAADNGAAFRAVVSNSSGSATSNAAILTIVSPPASGNLIAAYSFNEGANTTVADASGRGHTGTISGATWTTGRSGAGSALSFDGINDWVTVNDTVALDLTTAMTLEAWVFPTRAGDWQTIVVKERAGNPSVYGLMGSTGTPPTPSGKVFLTSGANERIIAPSALPLNTWTHVATTYDGSTLRFYVNGAQVASRALSGAILTSTGPLRIGGNSVFGEFFQGRIDDVRIYNRALTASEIQTNMNTPVHP